MDIDIDKLTIDELVALNHRIVQRLKMLDSLHAHKAMMEFNLGTRVSFDSPNPALAGDPGQVQPKDGYGDDGYWATVEYLAASAVAGQRRQTDANIHLCQRAKL